MRSGPEGPQKTPNETSTLTLTCVSTAEIDAAILNGKTHTQTCVSTRTVKHEVISYFASPPALGRARIRTHSLSVRPKTKKSRSCVDLRVQTHFRSMSSLCSYSNTKSTFRGRRSQNSTYPHVFIAENHKFLVSPRKITDSLFPLQKRTNLNTHFAGDEGLRHFAGDEALRHSRSPASQPNTNPTVQSVVQFIEFSYVSQCETLPNSKR